MSNRVIAVFDLDGTLTTSRSLEKAFAKFIYDEGSLNLNSLFIHAAYFFCLLPFSRIKAIKQNKLYLKGLSEQRLQETAKRFISLFNQTLIADYALPLLESHKQQGHMNILITGSLEVLVSQLVEQMKLPFDQIFATELGMKNGTLTGRIEGRHYYAESKSTLVKRLAETTGCDLSKSFCYADSYSDYSMMKLFGNPVAVRPDKRLAAIAKKLSWKTIDLKACNSGKA